MKLTKYEHACFTLEKDDHIIVVDPGSFSTDFLSPEHVATIVITHQHPDHFDPEQIAAIIDKNPDAVIFAHPAITSQIESFTTRSVLPGDKIDVGPFHLVFFGGEHATIHQSIPGIPNLGILINDLVYYPGDSFVVPEQAIDTLLLPLAAPWMKSSEAIDFLLAVRPRLAMPTHDAILSDSGKMIFDRLMANSAKANDITYLRTAEPIEI